MDLYGAMPYREIMELGLIWSLALPGDLSPAGQGCIFSNFSSRSGREKLDFLRNIGKNYKDVTKYLDEN